MDTATNALRTARFDPATNTLYRNNPTAPLGASDIDAVWRALPLSGSMWLEQGAAGARILCASERCGAPIMEIGLVADDTCVGWNVEVA